MLRQPSKNGSRVYEKKGIRTADDRLDVLDLEEDGFLWEISVRS